MRASRIQQSMDIGLLLAVLTALVIGLVAITSATYVVSGLGKTMKQLIFAIIGTAGMLVMANIDYRSWSRYWRLFLTLTLLGLFCILFAPAVKGAHSWVKLGSISIEPSEFAKLAMILAFAALLSRYGARIKMLPYFLWALLFFAFPILLVLKQPALGTAVILCAICFVMLYAAGARWWMLVSLCLSAVLLFIIAWNVGFIKQYQKERLNYLNADEMGGGYHQRQARIAIGSGMLWGKGSLHGTQAQRGFLPEPDTDFIFTVIGEEYGFLGSLLFLALHLFILFRILRIAEESETPYGRFIATGVAAMLTVHTVINVSMCLSLTPVTGIPLPFTSYGGSHLLTFLLAVGVVLNISRYRLSRRRWADENTLVRAE